MEGSHSTLWIFTDDLKFISIERYLQQSLISYQKNIMSTLIFMLFKRNITNGYKKQSNNLIHRCKLALIEYCNLKKDVKTKIHMCNNYTNRPKIFNASPLFKI